MILQWRESTSSDVGHDDLEADLHDTGGACWAWVADEDGHWSWTIYSRWLWEDIDGHPETILAEGTAAGQEEAKAAVQSWVDEQEKR